MNINSEKLDHLLKFILSMLDRHEQGIRLSLGQDSSSPSESFSFQSFKESLDEKFSSLQKLHLKNSMKIEEIKTDLENRGDTVETLKYVLTTLDEHNSSLLRAEKLYTEVLTHKESVEKTVEELKNRLYSESNPVLDKSVIQGVEKSREHFPKYITKRYYVPSEAKPSGIFAQNEEKGENYESSPQNSSLNITKDTQISNNLEIVEQPSSNSSEKKQLPKAFKRKDRILKPGRVQEESHEDYLSSASEKSFKPSSKSPITQSRVEKLLLPSLPSQASFSDLTSRLESLEKIILKPPDNPETSSRIRNLEAMYRFIEQIVDSCEPLTIRNRDQIMHLVRNLKTLESEMTNKLNTEDFDAVRNLVITLASGAPQHDPTVIIPTAEVNKIRLLEKRIQELEKTLSDIVKVYPENIEEVSLKLRRIEQKLAIKISEEDLEPLWKKITEINEKIKNLASIEKGIQEKNTTAAKNFENLAFNAINRRLSAFEEIIRQLKIPAGLELSQLWEETKKNFQSFQNLKSLIEDLKKQEVQKRQEILLKLESRVDSSSLQSLEETCSKMLSDFSEKCFATFARQKDLKKISKFLQDLPKKEPERLKNEIDDAMIAKKPLGGWSCASCEKKLEKLSGRLASHSPWKKLPMRDASERMLKAGLGYSKMLTSLQLETLKSRAEGEEMLSHRNTDRSHTPYL
jgi:hypothetical protein